MDIYKYFWGYNVIIQDPGLMILMRVSIIGFLFWFSWILLFDMHTNISGTLYTLQKNYLKNCRIGLILLQRVDFFI